MKYGISLIVRGASATSATMSTFAARAEAVKLDALWVSDHLVMPKQTVSRYPGRADGEMPDGWKATYYQPFSVLNYLAAKTQNVRLGHKRADPAHAQPHRSRGANRVAGSTQRWPGQFWRWRRLVFRGV